MRNNLSKTLLRMRITFSIVMAGSPVHAVGPYFENQSPGSESSFSRP